MTNDKQLIEAAKYGKMEEVRKALAAGADINYADKSGNTPLIWACYNGHTEIARLLLEPQHKINVNHITKNDSTALGIACCWEDTKLLRLLLAHPDIDVYYTRPYGNTALTSAVRYSREDCIDLLVNHAIATINDEVLAQTYKNKQGISIDDLIKHVILKIVNENHPANEINRLLKLLNFLLSAYNGYPKKSARKEARTFLSDTIKKRVDTVIAAGDIESLQSEKEKIELICNGVTLLQKTKKDKSEKTDKVKIMKLIEKIELSIQALKAKKARWPLIQALYNEKPEKALKLIEKDGIDLNVQGEEGETALYLASEGGDERVVKALLRKKADPNLALRDGATPLYIAAAENDHPYIASKLLKYGADQGLKLKEKYSPLHIAAYRGNDDTVKTLLNHAASKKNGYQDLISTINDATSTVGMIVVAIKYNKDSTSTRKNIRKMLVKVLKERTQAAIRSNELAEVNAEIAGLQNIKMQVDMLQKRDGEKKEKTAMREIKAMITQLQVARMRLEKSMAATPANAAICLTVVDGIDKNQLASHLLMTEMTPNQKDDLLNALKELSIEQFDHLKQQLKDFVLLAKKDQAFLAEQGKLHSLFSTKNEDVYNANPFLFILRTGTSEYEQKNTDSFNTARDEIMGSAFMNGLKNLTTFALSRAAPKPDSKTVYRAIGDNSL